MILVIDANVAVALAIPQPYSVEARKAVAVGTRFIAPDLLVHETANVLCRLSAAGSLADWETPLDYIHLLIDEFAPSRRLAKSAVRDALGTAHSAYDMFYVALAREAGATLITADRKLARQCGRLGIAVTPVA